MADPFGLRPGDIEAVIAILQKESAVARAIIFGSRAKGNHRNGSDVDIALKGKKMTDAAAAHIGSLLNDETPMPYKFDVLNYHSIRNKDLLEQIDRVGVIFYTKEQGNE